MICWNCDNDMTEMRKLGEAEEAILLLTPEKKLWKCECGAREMSDVG